MSNSQRKILLIGWDSAGWDQIAPLLTQQKLPALAKLMERSTVGRVHSAKPFTPTVAFANIATGKYADQHGLLSEQHITLDERIEATGSMFRRSKAFWDILSQNKRMCDVLGFPGSGPAERINGSFVLRDLPVPTARGTQAQLPESVCVSPHRATLQKLIVSLGDLKSKLLLQFLPTLAEINPNHAWPQHIGRVLARTASLHRMATALLKHTEWDVLSINYPIIESLNSHYLQHHAPKVPWVYPNEFEALNAVTDAAVQMADVLLGQLLELAGDDAAIMLYSPTAYLPHAAMETLPDTQWETPETWRTGTGMLVLRTGTKPDDDARHDLAAVDLCPTLLHLAGVAPGADMDGRVCPIAVTHDGPLAERIDSWELQAPGRVPATEGRNIFDLTDVALDAAFPAWPIRLLRYENAWNLGEQWFASPARRNMAIPWMTLLSCTHPLDAARSATLAQRAERTQSLTPNPELASQVNQSINEWQRRYTSDLREGLKRLPTYLAANAEAVGTPFDLDAMTAITTPPGDVAKAEWVIRPAVPADLPTLTLMFKDPFDEPFQREVLVMHAADAPALVGAVLLLFSETSLSVKLGLSIRQDVAGEGSVFFSARLLQASLVRAAAGGATQASFIIPDDEAQAPLRRTLETMGFTLTLTQSDYTLDMADFRDRCLGVVERYKKRKPLPEDVRLVSLAEVPYEKVHAFLLDYFPDGCALPERRLCGRVSRVMLKGDDIIASFVGYKHSPDIFSVIRLGVDPKYRGLWITPWLLGDGSRQAYEDGHGTILFSTDEKTYPDFIKIARNNNTQFVRTVYTLTLPLATPWDEK